MTGGQTPPPPLTFAFVICGTSPPFHLVWLPGPQHLITSPPPPPDGYNSLQLASLRPYHHLSLFSLDVIFLKCCPHLLPLKFFLVTHRLRTESCILSLAFVMCNSLALAAFPAFSSSFLPWEFSAPARSSWALIAPAPQRASNILVAEALPRPISCLNTLLPSSASRHSLKLHPGSAWDLCCQEQSQAFWSPASLSEALSSWTTNRYLKFCVGLLSGHLH